MVWVLKGVGSIILSGMRLFVVDKVYQSMKSGAKNLKNWNEKRKSKEA